jgi:hypothetical protein
MSDPSQMTTTGDERHGGDVAALEKLFADGERWGWEERDVELLYEPFPTPEPKDPTKGSGGGGLQGGTSDWLDLATAGRPERANMFGLPDWASILRTRDPATILRAYLQTMLRLILLMVVWPFVFPVWLVRRGRSNRSESAEAAAKLKELQEARAELERRYQAELSAWQQAKREWDAKERRRLDALPIWGAVRPASRARRLDIYGGTITGWQSLTLTLGASMLGLGENLTVLDLSEADASAALFKKAAQRKSTSVRVLPENAHQFDPFAKLSTTATKDLLVEAFGSTNDAGPLGDRVVIDRILTAVCAALKRELTFARLHSAMRVLLRELPFTAEESLLTDDEDALSTDAQGQLLTDDEQARIADLFGEESRAVMRAQLVALEAQLAPLRELGCAVDSDYDAAAFECVGIAVGRESGALVNELLIRVLVQKAIHDLRAPERDGPRVLMVIGADRLQLRDIERLDDLTAAVGGRVVYLFRHIRGEVLDALGGSDAIAGVMRLGNPSEAEAAAKLIGRRERFELTQLTNTTTTSWSESYGTSESRSGLPTLSDSWGEVEQLSRAHAEGYTRVHKFVVEPDAFKNLTETGIVLVEFGSQDGKLGGLQDNDVRIRTADCQSVHAAHPRTSAEPFAQRPSLPMP